MSDKFKNIGNSKFNETQHSITLQTIDNKGDKSILP